MPHTIPAPQIAPTGDEDATSPSPSPTDSMSSNDSTDYSSFSLAPENAENRETKLAAEKVVSPDEVVLSTESGETTGESKLNGGASFVANEKKSSSPSFELLYWEDPVESGIVFGLGLFVFYCFVIREHTVLSLLASVIEFNLIINGLHLLLKKTPLFEYVKSYVPTKLPTVLDAAKTVSKLPLTLAVMNLGVSCFSWVADHVTKSLTECNSIAEFLAVFTGTYAVYLFGSWFSPTSLFFIAFLIAFSVPKTYQMFQKPIDAKLNEFSDKANEQYSKLMKNEKIRKAFHFVTNSEGENAETKKNI
jgi:hypothetical protein